MFGDLEHRVVHSKQGFFNVFDTERKVISEEDKQNQGQTSWSVFMSFLTETAGDFLRSITTISHFHETVSLLHGFLRTVSHQNISQELLPGNLKTDVRGLVLNERIELRRKVEPEEQFMSHELVDYCLNIGFIAFQDSLRHFRLFAVSEV